MLRHENPEEQNRSAALELSRAELSEVLNEAIARQSEGEPTGTDVATLEEAIEIARQVNVPEEHVLAAAAALRRRKEAAALAVRRDEKRELVRQGRQRAFLASAVGTALAAALAFVLAPLGIAWAWGGAIALALLALYQGARWIALPVTDAEADRVELPPVAGTCRVCGSPAYTPRATFCEEHRYQGPE
jgi:hypothetical protein